jgi:hypothetical protein
MTKREAKKRADGIRAALTGSATTLFVCGKRKRLKRRAESNRQTPDGLRRALTASADA